MTSKRTPSVAYREKPWIISQILQDQPLRLIAASLGCSGPNISQRLAKDPDYRNARRTALERRLLQAQRDLVDARHSRSPKGITITLARVRFRRLLAFAQAHFPKHWPSNRTPSYGNPDSDAWRIAAERNKKARSSKA